MTLAASGKGETQSPDASRAAERIMPAPTDLQRAAELLELWRLCRKSSCRRARACRGDARACCEILADWSETLSLKDKRLGFAEAMERLGEQRGQ
jgi:hypothetical protein